MEKAFKSLTIVAILLTIVFGFSVGIREYLYNVRIGQYLGLADDASLPALKVEYLVRYKEAVEQQIKGEDARYIFKRERLTKTAQLKSLESLIVRLQDISKLTPESMAYQQGMQQVSGQEFEHTMNEINGIFGSCYDRDYFVERYTVGWLLIISIVTIVVAGIGWLTHI